MRRLLDNLVGAALALLLGGMTILVFASIMLRYVFNNPVTWSEELASLLFAWLTFVGAYLGFRSRSHIMIDTLVIYLPAGLRRGLARAVDLCVLALLALMVWQGVSLTITTWSLEFPAMEISRGYLYLSLPLGAFLAIVAILLTWSAGRTSAQEEQP
jgi:TRAP-type transport system small permease protein